MRWLPLSLLVATAGAAALASAACTSGTTAICDDAGTCLLGVPPDGSVVTGDGTVPEGGSEAAPEAAPTPEAGEDATDAGDATDATDAADAAG